MYVHGKYLVSLDAITTKMREEAYEKVYPSAIKNLEESEENSDTDSE